MSTHIDGLHTDNTTIALSTNAELAEHYAGIEEFDDKTVLALEAPGNCHLVVVEGDLETFARNVWSAVFDQNAPASIAEDECPRHGGRWGSDETCQDCVDYKGDPRPRCGHNNQHLDENRLVVCDDCEQTMLPTDD